MYYKTTIGNPEGSVISTLEYYEVEYWAKKLNVSVPALKAAIATVGTSTEAVKQFLK